MNRTGNTGRSAARNLSLAVQDQLVDIHDRTEDGIGPDQTYCERLRLSGKTAGDSSLCKRKASLDLPRIGKNELRSVVAVVDDEVVSLLYAVRLCLHSAAGAVLRN